MKHCLSIAGSDCSGGAGIQADLKTFSALGTFGMSVVTSVVAENTSRVISIQDVDTAIVNDQIDAVFEDIRVDAVKVGMLSGAGIMQVVAGKLRQYAPKVVVIDPVMVAQSGGVLMQADALDALIHDIIPLATVLTPNLPEAEKITGQSIQNEEQMREAARQIHTLGAQAVLVKGGHLSGDALDILYDGEQFHRFVQPRIVTNSTHGTGCTLSSAIAANMANGMPVAQAVEAAKEYITNAIRYAFEVGKGDGPTNHFYEFYREKGIQ